MTDTRTNLLVASLATLALASALVTGGAFAGTAVYAVWEARALRVEASQAIRNHESRLQRLEGRPQERGR